MIQKFNLIHFFIQKFNLNPKVNLIPKKKPERRITSIYFGCQVSVDAFLVII